MAHTDACKIQVCQFVKKCEDNGMSINQACKEAERESGGIPAETIRSWWYESLNEEEVVEFSTTHEQPTVTPQSDNEIPKQSSLDEIKPTTFERWFRGLPKNGERGFNHLRRSDNTHIHAPYCKKT